MKGGAHILQLKDVYKTFKTHDKKSLSVLEGINLTVKEGEFLSILGPSGCGKSTLLNLIAGLEPTTSGEVLFKGEKIKGPSSKRVVVFQSDGLFPWLTIKENVAYGLKISGQRKEEADKKSEEMLKLVHLSKYIDAYPHELSGGMKQRAAIARALVMEPDLLLMDEPFAALDEQTRLVLHKELIDIWRKTKVTIVFITHNIRESVLLSEKIVVMSTRPGKLKKIFTPEIYRDGMTPSDLTLALEKDIMAVLKEEIEKVLKEEMGDAYSLSEDSLSDDPDRHMGSHI